MKSSSLKMEAVGSCTKLVPVYPTIGCNVSDYDSYTTVKTTNPTNQKNLSVAGV
jgi:hypothetical protein